MKDFGEQRLKNIAEPVQVYSVSVNGSVSFGDGAQGKVPSASNGGASGTYRRGAGIAGAVAVLAAIAVGAVWFATTSGPPPPTQQAPRLSIVVLPFTNLSGDPAQAYLADVITEELTASLSRIRDTFVIARSTAFTYKGKAVAAKQVGRELGVRYVLEGSEQHSDSRVRVNAQLIDAETGAHLWADKFDTDRVDLLQTQDQIVLRLARALQIELSTVDAARVARSPPGNAVAEDLAMRCQAALLKFGSNRNEMETGYRLCDEALQADENNVRASSVLARRFALRVIQGQSADPPGDIRKADELISRALIADPNDYFAHYARAYVLIVHKRFDEAVVEAERSLALNPSFTNAYATLWTAHVFAGRPEEAIEYDETAIRTSPHDPMLYEFYWHRGQYYFTQQEDDKAIEWLRRSIAANPDFPLPQATLTAAFALNGRDAEARETLARYLSLNQTTVRTISQWKSAIRTLSDNPAWLASNERFYEGLRKAGLPEE